MITCPQPTNDLLNNLNGNTWEFGLQRVPNLVYKCQKVTIPEISIEPPRQSTPLFDIPLKGSNLVWSDLQVDFILDEKLENYKFLYYWLTTFCKGSACDCVQNIQNLYDNDHLFDFSDAFINIYSPNKANLLHRIKFIDCIITGLGSIPLDTTNADVQPLVTTVSFKYAYWTFGDILKPMEI